MSLFYVDDTRIVLSRGDTGSVTITSEGYDFSENDRALFTLKDGTGAIVMQKQYPIVNGEFTVQFRNADTDSRPTGSYTWDVRYIINPFYDESGAIVDGDQVITPNLPMMLEILDTVGEV